jgi:hypothetical protein
MAPNVFRMVTIAALVTLPSMAVAPAAAQSGSASFQVPCSGTSSPAGIPTWAAT